MVKSHEKKNVKIIFRDTTSDMVKCRRDQQEKMMDYDYREEYLKGLSYIKPNIIRAVLRKANSHSLLICRLIRKSIM